MKTLLLAGCVGMAMSTALAYWAPTPIEELAAKSDCVVIGTVKQIVGNTNTHRVLVTMDELMTLKGERYAGASVTFDAPFSLNQCVLPPLVNGKRQFTLNSFSSNETCAVFLKWSHDRTPGLHLCQDDDGKFIVNWGNQSITRAMMTTDSESLKEFQKRIAPVMKVNLVSPPPPFRADVPAR